MCAGNQRVDGSPALRLLVCRAAWESYDPQHAAVLGSAGARRQHDTPALYAEWLFSLCTFVRAKACVLPGELRPARVSR